MSKIDAFFAYALRPEKVSEMIRMAITRINQNSPEVSVLDWQNMNVTGNIIIDQICQQIDRASLFICDLTTNNENVLFELGYAIAKNKRIWVSLNPDEHNAEERYKSLKLLTTLAYEPYRTEFELERRFLNSAPFHDLDNTILKNHQHLLYQSPHNLHNYIFYMKSYRDTPASEELTKLLRKEAFQTVLDDPREGADLSLNWYLQHVKHSVAVITHLSDERSEDTSFNDAKYAFTAGLAYGFQKTIKIFAHTPYVTPIDYRDITEEHQNVEECINIYEKWIGDVREKVEERKKESQHRKQKFEQIEGIRSIEIGDWRAENERDSIAEYFVETEAYRKAYRANEYILFIGQKGTGKTANFVRLASKLENERRDNFVCKVRPKSIRIEKISDLFDVGHSIESQDFLIESIWKFLVYTELAIQLKENINSRPAHVLLSDTEQEFIKFMQLNKRFVQGDFSDRLEYALIEICDLDLFEGKPAEKSLVSEKLHKNILGRLRELLGELLSKRERVVVLIDDLDQGWIQRPDLKALANFLFGLLNVAKHIEMDLRKETQGRKALNFSALVFLRSDIYSYIKFYSGEEDKLRDDSRIDWDDKALLLRVIEQRFQAAANEQLLSEDVWVQYFVEKVKGKKTPNYIFSRILPRPRDVVYFVSKALSKAKDHGNTIIEENDILEAEEEYSKFALSLLTIELDKEFPIIREENDFFYKFMGISCVLEQNKLMKIIQDKIETNRIERLIDLFIQNSFLGIETEIDNFEYFYHKDRESKRKMVVKADRIESQTDRKRYRIHNAFHAWLEIKAK